MAANLVLPVPVVKMLAAYNVQRLNSSKKNGAY